MKILAFSDVRKWEGYEEIVDRIKPNVIALAGDLTSEGFASFWSKDDELVEQSSGYQKEKERLEKELPNRLSEVQCESKNDEGSVFTFRYKNLERTVHWVKGRPNQSDIIRLKKEILLDALKEIYIPAVEKDFLKYRKEKHVDLFYKFLKTAGKKSKVLVVKGDHDDDYEDDYITEKINKISGCKEISGEIEKIKNLNFLGLSFNDTHYAKNLDSIVEKFKNRVDVVITHCEQNKVPIVSGLNPKIIIRGHFGSGKYLVNGIPSVFTSDVKYTVVNIKANEPLQILQYTVDSLTGKPKILEKGSCAPWFSNVSEFERYEWLKPYPDDK